MPPERLTVLFLAANPEDTDHLKLDEEVRIIDEALQSSEHRDRFDLRSHWAVRYDDLHKLLERYKPQIVHFAGHGSNDGEIVFMNDMRRNHPVPPETLTELFVVLKDNIRCVVLSACYSDTQAHGIAQAIDYVVGMTRAVTDDAAADFAAGFYLGLASGRSVVDAFALGKNRVALAGHWLDGESEESTPKLLAHRVDPANGYLVAGIPAKERADFYLHISRPQNYVPRPELLAKLKEAIIDDDNRIVAVTSASPTDAFRYTERPIAVHGMGGIGKTAAVRMLCEDPDVRFSYPDGILWATVSQNPDLAARLREWAHVLRANVTQNAPSLEELKNAVALALQDRACLLIADDVWDTNHVDAFLVGGPRCRLLVTTRKMALAKDLGAAVRSVPLMTEAEAITLLEESAAGALGDTELTLKRLIVARLGRLPLAVRLSGRQMRHMEPLAWFASFSDRKLNKRYDNEIDEALEKCFRLSLEELGAHQQHLYSALAVFKEDEPIYGTAVAKLWRGLLGMDEASCRAILCDMADRSLLQRLPDEVRDVRVVVHDLLRDFMLADAGAEGVRGAHRALLQSYRLAQNGAGWHTIKDDGYIYDHLVYHLTTIAPQDAQADSDLTGLFTSDKWLHTRVNASDLTYGPYIRDMEAVWARRHVCAVDSILQGRVSDDTGECFRYALIRSRVQSLSGSYEPAFVLRAAELGIWPIRRVFDLMRQMPQARQRMRVVNMLYSVPSLLRAEHRAEIEEMICQAGIAILQAWTDETVYSQSAYSGDKSLREDLQCIVQYVRIRPEAIKLAQEAVLAQMSVAHTSLWLDFIAASTAFYDETFCRSLMEFAAKEEHYAVRVEMMVALLPGLNQEDRGKAVEDATDTLAKMTGSYNWLEALKLLAPALDSTQVIKVLTAAAAAYERYTWTYAVHSLFPYMAPIAIAHALAVTEGLELHQYDKSGIYFLLALKIAPQADPVSVDLARRLKASMDQDWRVLLGFAEHIDSTRLIDISNEIAVRSSWGTYDLFDILAGYVVDPGGVKFALDHIRLKYFSPTAIAALLPRLSEEERAEFLPEILEALSIRAVMLPSPAYCVRLITYCNVDNAEVMIETLLESILWHISDGNAPWLAAIAPFLTSAQAQRVVNILPGTFNLEAGWTIARAYWQHLDVELKRAMVLPVLQIESSASDSWKTEVIHKTVGFVPQDLIAKTIDLAKSISAGDKRSQALALIVSHMGADELRLELAKAPIVNKRSDLRDQDYALEYLWPDSVFAKRMPTPLAGFLRVLPGNAKREITNALPPTLLLRSTNWRQALGYLTFSSVTLVLISVRWLSSLIYTQIFFPIMRLKYSDAAHDDIRNELTLSLDDSSYAVQNHVYQDVRSCGWLVTSDELNEIVLTVSKIQDEFTRGYYLRALTPPLRGKSKSSALVAAKDIKDVWFRFHTRLEMVKYNKGGDELLALARADMLDVLRTKSTTWQTADILHFCDGRYIKALQLPDQVLAKIGNDVEDICNEWDWL